MNLELYLQEIMRNVASALMLPVMIVLVCLILFSVYSIGSILAEFFFERRHFKANMPRDIKAIKDSSYDELPGTIENTGLLRRQKTALQILVANMGLPEDDLFALARAEVSATDAWNRRKVARTDLVTKIAPMMGLMCTLIPLGPGIVAMGQGEVNLLSNSLLVAFDGTVAGLIGGVVSMCVSSVRKRWYANYLVAMESLTTCVLEKAQEARAEGIELPCEGDIRVRADMSRAGVGRAPRTKRNEDGGQERGGSKTSRRGQSAPAGRTAEHPAAAGGGADFVASPAVAQASATSSMQPSAYAYTGSMQTNPLSAYGGTVAEGNVYGAVTRPISEYPTSASYGATATPSATGQMARVEPLAPAGYAVSPTGELDASTGLSSPIGSYASTAYGAQQPIAPGSTGGFGGYGAPEGAAGSWAADSGSKSEPPQEWGK